MRSLDESRLRWQEFHRDGGDFVVLQRAVKFDGPNSPCEAGCRSVCWKAFLLFRNIAPSDYRLVMREAREHYEALGERYLQFIKHPERLAELTVDPLADDPESPWDAFRRDETIRAEILQDVRRLPDNPLFHQERVQTLILDVLFVFCKQNPDIGGYRQGMHELLAPIVYVLSEDAIDTAYLQPPGASDAEMVEMLNSHYIEHDAYAMFSKIMERAKAFYETSIASVPQKVTDSTSVADEFFPTLTPPSAANIVEGSAIVELSKEIHEGTLMKVDPELATHLKNIEILPQIFLIRWIRLLFGREFPFEHHLVLWDSIFAFDPDLHLVPLICVAMLLRIRWQLLDGDYSVALQPLLKYPAPQAPYGPNTLVDDAVFLRDHLDTAGGANLILKYTGRQPARVLSPQSSSPGSTSRPSTPSAAISAGFGSLRNRTLKVARSPLRSTRRSFGSGEGLGVEGVHTASSSPSRFLQGRENMEALFGAAKGVIERGEKLGINQAVRDAVGEIRRNMAHGLQEAKQAANRVPSASKGDPFVSSSGSKRMSYGEAMRTIAEMERRNQQLANMLGETVTALKDTAQGSLKDLNAGSDEIPENEKAQVLEQQQQWLEVVELAAAKVQFVKVYLEDSSLVLPLDDPVASEACDDTPPVLPEKAEETASTTDTAGTGLKPAAEVRESPKSYGLQSNVEDAGVVSEAVTQVDGDHMDMDEEDKPQDATQMSLSPLARAVLDIPTSEPVTTKPPPATQEAENLHTIPARSTLAQSSFAWMLEPGDTASNSAYKSINNDNNSSSVNSASSRASFSPAPPKKAPSRPSPAGRSRHAFLFGEVVSQSPLGGGGDDAGSSPNGSRHSMQTDGPETRSRSIASDEIFGLEPLRRALPREKE